jgi:hypothetical protein
VFKRSDTHRPNYQLSQTQSIEPLAFDSNYSRMIRDAQAQGESFMMPIGIIA